MTRERECRSLLRSRSDSATGEPAVAGEGRPDQSSERIADDLVALAGGALESNPIDHLNPAAQIRRSSHD